jgi:hypothetical protein
MPGEHLAALPFSQIWAVDFEFAAPDGERPDPVCLVAWELRSGRRIKLWRDDFGPAPPYPIDASALFVAYYASAELGCHKALGWPMPERILDLFAEFRDRTNGFKLLVKNTLIGALSYFGLPHIGADEKREMRDLVRRGGPWTAEERAAVLDYCESDVDALARLLPAMLPALSSRVELSRALLRGRYMTAAAAMEHAGTPIDVPTLERLRNYWPAIRDRLIVEIDANYGIYGGGSFREARFEAFLARNGISWSRLDTGKLELTDQVFREAAKVHPIISPLRELRDELAEGRLAKLVVGKDGRNRAILSAFGTKTGRNAPSSSKFIFGASVWLRQLIKPPPGFGLAYIDWSQQEFGIAAALSGDLAMQAAYLSGDPYLAFAKKAGAVPDDATAASHGAERELFKTCALGVQYGMQETSLAVRIGKSRIAARDLLAAHRETYPAFWRWSDAAVDCAMLRGSLPTVFGWHILAGEDANPRSFRNFPMQANGAEMMRLACCLATERGVEICAPVHDAMLICAPLYRLGADVRRMQAAMAKASRAVLSGFELRSDAKIIRYPNRYADRRGAVMWERACRLTAEAEKKERRA